MGGLFSSNKTKKSVQKEAGTNNPSITDKDRAILDLKNSRDKLKKHRKKLENESSKLEGQAKELIRKQQKQRALLVLKLRRHREVEVNKVDAQLINILEMINNVEWESQNLQIMKAMKEGTAALNKIHEEMSIDDVANLLEETNEAIEMENQIGALLAGQFTVTDDAELEKELEELMGESHNINTKRIPEISQMKLPEVPNIPVMPTVPDQPLHSQPERGMVRNQSFTNIAT
eukprot:gene8354-11300_t